MLVLKNNVSIINRLKFIFRLIINIQNRNDKGNNATRPFVRKPKNNIMPDKER